MNIDINTIIIGFISGIIGGVAVNLISYHFTKKSEQKIKLNEQKKLCKKRIKVILQSIIDTWDREMENGEFSNNYHKIEREFDSYSDELNQLIVFCSESFYSDSIEERLIELKYSLKKVKGIITSHSSDIKKFISICDDIRNETLGIGIALDND